MLATAGETPKASGLSLAASLGYESQYVNYGTQYAEAIYVPTLHADYGGIYANLWMAVPAINAELYDTEADFSAGWKHELSEAFSLDLGVTRYAYNNIGDDFLNKDNSLEFYVGVGANLPLSPTLYAYRDIDCNSSTYVIDISHSFELARQFNLNLGAEAGYIRDDEDDYSFYAASADLEYKLSENTSFTAGVRYGGSSEDRIFKDGYDKDWRKNIVWYGFGVQTAF
jgi:hypothetical protein